MLYVPLGVLSKGYYSVSINTNGPVVKEATVLVVVAAILPNVSLANTFNADTPYRLMQ
jgi:hypothetical protein